MGRRSSVSSVESFEEWASQPTKKPLPPVEKIAGSVFLITSDGEILKLPISSASPRDPLAWALATRVTAFVCTILFSGIALVTVNLPPMLQRGLEQDFPDQADEWLTVKALNPAMTLFVSLGYLLAIPLSAAIGRRPVVLSTSALLTGMMLWAGLVTSFRQLLVATCLQGIGVGGALSMCLLIIWDGTFIHERPYAFSIFWANGALVFSLVMMGYPAILDPSTEWRPMYKAFFGPCLLVFLLALLFIPETYFVRPPIAFDGQILVQSNPGEVQIYESFGETPCGQHCQHLNRACEAPGPSNWAQRLKVSRAPGSSCKGGLATFVQMALCLASPVLIWVSLLSAALLSSVIFIAQTLPAHIAAHRLADANHVRLGLGVSGVVGSIVALLATGPLITWLIKHYAIHSSGMRHAESYLPSFILPIVSGALAVGLFALAKTFDWHIGAYYFIYGLSHFSYITTSVATALWITEAFPPWTAASFAIQKVSANLIAFGVGIGLHAGLKTDESLRPNIGILILILILGGFAIPLAFWGKKVRKYMQDKWTEY